jgi:hypothetical protein
MEWHTVTRLSPRMHLTDEGYLVCRDVPVARTGTQVYFEHEVPPLQGDSGGRVHVSRDASEVFKPLSISTFEGKPICDDHPMEPVGPANWHNLSIGYVSNPRRGEGTNDDLLFADLIFTTQKGIDAVQGGKRAISVGYNAFYEQTAPGLGRQKDIHCNHVALVDEGRCGARCSIMDGKTVYTGDLHKIAVTTPAGTFHIRKHGEVERYREGYHNAELDIEREFSRPEWLTDLPQPDIDFPSETDDPPLRPGDDEDIDYPVEDVAEFRETQHPRGGKGSGKGGEFVAKGTGSGGTERTQEARAGKREQRASRTERQGRQSEAQGKAVEAGRKPQEAAAKAAGTPTTTQAPEAAQSAPKAAASGVGKLTPTKTRAYTGQQVATKTQLTKQETGAIGEAVITNYMKQFGGLPDARPLNMKESNFPVDMIGDHELIEIKTGLVSNSSSAQKWRATIGQPGKAEAAWLAKAKPEEKAAWNQKKMQAIMDRKMAVLKEYQQKYGNKVQGKTVTAIINPDTRTADLFQYNGFHLNIRWNSDETKKSYVGSYSY